VRTFCSTNPHFGVFLPPVALVGDPMQSRETIRLQVNQVRRVMFHLVCLLPNQHVEYLSPKPHQLHCNRSSLSSLVLSSMDARRSGAAEHSAISARHRRSIVWSFVA
jgi:hypothetical protein